MSGNLALIACGFDLREEPIAEAITSRASTKALLLHLATISAPDTGIAKVLLLYARMATTACDWLDGDLRIELVSVAEETSIEAFTELGGGFRERLFAPMTFRAPLAEFARAIARVPHMISPLMTRSVTASRIRLSATEQMRRTTIPPPPITIAAESLLVRISAPGVPVEAGEGFFELPLPIVEPRMATLEVPGPILVREPTIAPAPPAPGRPSEPPRPTSEPPMREVDEGWDE